MDDSREVPNAHPLHSPHSTQWEEEDVKAQEDLLSLKILQDPGFLARVPTLNPDDTGLERVPARAEGHSNASAADPARSHPDAQPLNPALSAEHANAESNFKPTPSMAPSPYGAGDGQLGSPDRARRNDFEPAHALALTPRQIEDTHLKMITQEVTQRVLEQLEDLLPELIASTLEEVLSGGSAGSSMGSTMDSTMDSRTDTKGESHR